MSETAISIRKFSRDLKVSDTAVRKAIKADKIVKGVQRDEAGNPTGIFPVIALKEWKENSNPNTFRAGKNAVDEKEDLPEPPPKKEDETSLAQINRAKAFVELKLKKLELEKKQGTLVEVEKVYQQLFNAGKEISGAILVVPDRVIDNILACSNRTDAHALLYKELEGALEKMARLPEINFASA